MEAAAAETTAAAENSRNDETESYDDAPDEFPFDDCCDVFSDSDSEPVSLMTENQNSHSPATNLRRRRPSSRCSSSYQSPDPVSPVSLENVSNSNEIKKKFETLEMNENELNIVELSSSSGSVQSSLSDERKPNFIITGNGDDELYRFQRVDLRRSETDDSNVLVFLADSVIKAIAFQVNLLISVMNLTVKFILFPIRTIYSAYMFVMDPFRVVRCGKRYILRKCVRVSSFVFGNVMSLVSEWLKDQKPVWRFGLKCGWGLLWSGYVAVVLLGLLVFAFIAGGLLRSFLVEEPIRIVENLNFDYTEKSPVAFVPIIGCQGVNEKIGFRGQVDVGKADGVHLIPPKHKFQAAVFLTLPESDYNRKLGVFQVRIDLLGPNGMVLASARHPCMLQFRSEPIRLLSTFINIAPLITGYAKESQDLNVEFKGFSEGDVPTACMRVTIEQRAEFHPGGGIPQLYTAILTLESELPLLKRFLWYWKATLFVWISMTLFTVELLFALLCCRPLIIPRIRLVQPRTNNAPRNNPQNQG